MRYLYLLNTVFGKYLPNNICQIGTLVVNMPRYGCVEERLRNLPGRQTEWFRLL
jgi:hypothetical protein